MKISNRRSAVSAIVPALAALLMSPLASADSSSSKPGCHEEIRRVAVWPVGSPKGPSHATFEERLLTICDGEIISRRPVEAKDKAEG